MIFQPAEEGGTSAKAMLRDGLFDSFGIQEISACRLSGMPVGQFAIRSGR